MTVRSSETVHHLRTGDQRKELDRLNADQWINRETLVLLELALLREYSPKRNLTFDNRRSEEKTVFVPCDENTKRLKGV